MPGYTDFYKAGKKVDLIKTSLTAEDYEGLALILNFGSMKEAGLINKIGYKAEDWGFTKEYIKKELPKEALIGAGKLAGIVTLGIIASTTVDKLSNLVPVIDQYIGEVLPPIARGIVGWHLSKKWFEGRGGIPTRVFETLGKLYAIGAYLSAAKNGIGIIGNKLGVWTSPIAESNGFKYKKLTDISSFSDILPTFRSCTSSIIEAVPTLGLAIAHTAGLKFKVMKNYIVKKNKDLKLKQFAKPLSFGLLGFVGTKVALNYAGVDPELTTQIAHPFAAIVAYLSANSENKWIKGAIKTGAFLYGAHSLAQIPGIENLTTKVGDFVGKTLKASPAIEKISELATLYGLTGLGIAGMKYAKENAGKAGKAIGNFAKSIPSYAWTATKYIAGKALKRVSYAGTKAWQLKWPALIGGGIGLGSYLAIKEGLPHVPYIGVDVDPVTRSLISQYMGTMATYISCGKALVKNKTARTIGKIGSLMYGAHLLTKTPFVKDAVESLKSSAENLIPKYQATTEKLGGIKSLVEGAKVAAYSGAKTATGYAAKIAASALAIGGLGEALKATYRKIRPSRA